MPLDDEDDLPSALGWEDGDDLDDPDDDLDDDRAGEEGRWLGAPICPWCGATALPVDPVDGDPGYVCETAGCEAFGLRLVAP